MPVSINLRRMSVTGWKAIREPLEIEFDGESWLIHGENEVGKSSIFSALRFVLFENPDARGAWSANWVNNQSPEAVVEVELLIDGDPFTIIKTRSAAGNGNTRLFEGIGTARIEHSTNREGVNEILDLVGARPRSRRGDDEIPSDWGILAWLLAPQGMDSVSPARQQGTQTLGLERAISEYMVRVEEVLRDYLFEELTPGGQEKTRGTFRAAVVEVSDAEQHVEEIERSRVQFTEVLQDARRKEDEIVKAEEKLTEAEDEVETLRDTDIDLTQREGEITNLETQKGMKQSQVKAASTAIGDLKTIDNELAQHKQELRDAEGNIRLKSTEKNDLDTTFTEKNQLLESTRVSHQETIESIEAKNSQIVAATQIQQRDELRGKIDSLDKIDEEESELEAQGPIIDDETLDGMNDLAVRLERSEGMLISLSESHGISVEVEGQLEASWEVDGQETEVESDTRFAQHLKVDGEGFSINLNRELADDTDWVQKRAKCMSELGAHGVSSAEELRSKERTERKRAASMRTISHRKSILGDRDIIADHLEKLSDVQDLTEDTLDIEVLDAEVTELKNQRDVQKGEIEFLAETVEGLFKERQALGEEITDIRAKEESSKGLVANCAGRRDVEISTDGTMKIRKTAHSELTGELTDLINELTERTALRDAEKNAHTDGLTRANRTKTQLEKELRHLKAELIALENKGQGLGGANLQRDFIDAQKALNIAESTKDRIQSRVRAEERLLKRFQSALRDATELEIDPIKKRVETWLAIVTDGRWTQLEMDSLLNVTELHGPNRSIDGEEVGSMGLKQLIHALIRLSVACHIHDDKVKAQDNPDFPSVALVMDESQSHVSDGRVDRLMRIFNREITAGRVQVITLSHRMSEFQGLNGINYNVERREATDLRDIEEEE